MVVESYLGIGVNAGWVLETRETYSRRYPALQSALGSPRGARLTAESYWDRLRNECLPAPGRLEVGAQRVPLRGGSWGADPVGVRTLGGRSVWRGAAVPLQAAQRAAEEGPCAGPRRAVAPLPEVRH